MDRIRCTFVRLADGVEISTVATAGANRLGYAWIKASEAAADALGCALPGIELECVWVQENDEPPVTLARGWSRPKRDELARDMRRAG